MRSIKNRDSCSEAHAKKVMSNQMPVAIKVKRAEIAIDNSGSSDELYTKFIAELTKPGIYTSG